MERNSFYWSQIKIAYWGYRDQAKWIILWVFNTKVSLGSLLKIIPSSSKMWRVMLTLYFPLKLSQSVIFWIFSFAGRPSGWYCLDNDDDGICKVHIHPNPTILAMPEGKRYFFSSHVKRKFFFKLIKNCFSQKEIWVIKPEKNVPLK